ncbi:MAG: site-specific integrase [Nevskiaceae bacterium]|nr:MAG: site-specific integrase [Nevskiaceae bacterium]
MRDFVAKRARFRNGERLSVLMHQGMPVQLAVLFLNRYRARGNAANTIHQVCEFLAMLHNHLAGQHVDLWERLCSGRFLSAPELDSFAMAAQFKVKDLDEDQGRDIEPRSVVNLERARLRRTRDVEAQTPVGPSSHANRIRYAHKYLVFATDYVRPMLPAERAAQFSAEVRRGLDALYAQIPKVSNRATINARTGMSEDHELRLLDLIRPDSPLNPWKSAFVKARNELIVVLLLAGGMRRGELLGLQIRDIMSSSSTLQILRRPDAKEDGRVVQPNTKTRDREIPLSTGVMRRLESFISNDRRAIKKARRIPQIFTSDEGEALSSQSLSQIFVDLRTACPELPPRLSAHVMRHTWNERFSEYADKAAMTPAEEENARSEHQGWVQGSLTSGTYTRRHARAKARKLALEMQDTLERNLDGRG